MENKWVNVTPNYPITSDFTTTSGLGSPICVDASAAIAYTLIDDIITPISGIKSVTSKAALAALPSSVGSIYLNTTRSFGLFDWVAGNQSAEVTLDPQQGVYIAPTSDPTGASGAWVRRAFRIRPRHFEAVADGITPDNTALDAMNTWFFASVRSDRFGDFTGNYAYNGTFNLGPAVSTDNDSVRYNVGGDFRFVQKTGGTFSSIKPRNLALTLWQGRMTAQGIGGTTFSARTCAIGIDLINCPQLKATGGMRAYSFWYIGVAFQSLGPVNSSGFNDAASMGPIRTYYCGSGLSIAGFSLTANWSAPVNNGGSGSTTQTTTLTIDALPNAAIETYVAIGSQPIGVVIAGTFYYVQSWNRAGLTINIYPWLDNTSFATGSGTLRWVFGAGVATWGNDSGILTFDHIQAIDCGIGIWDGALYGSRFNSLNLVSNGINLIIGSATNGAHIGTSIDAFYTEASDFDMIVIPPRGGGSFSSYINSSYALNLAKVFGLCPRVTTGELLGGTLGSGQLGADTLAGGFPIMTNGFFYWVNKRQIGNEATTAMTFREHGRPPRVLQQHVNTQTVTFAVVGSGEYNRLFGYDGATLRYVGTGPNNAPTGNIIFTPPAGGTINGGAVNASLTFNTFDGAADFECYHSDTAQLTWIVSCVAGQSRINPNPLGYTAAARGTVTQTTARTSGVICNAYVGQITLFSAAGSAAWTTFVVNNNLVTVNDTIILNQVSGADKYLLNVTRKAAGVFDITFATTGGVTVEQPVFSFLVLKG